MPGCKTYEEIYWPILTGVSLLGLIEASFGMPLPLVLSR